MSFVDAVTVKVLAGAGGDGKLSFRREKFIARGGPDGGDGGHGGDVVLLASRNQNTLAAFRYQKELKAEPGKPGGKSNKHGRSGKNLEVAVPVGTVATSPDGRPLADLTEDGQKVVVARGGRGGFGNAHFTSSRRQTPKFAEKGEPGETLEIKLELKMIADVGLVGLPNAGKSTLLARLSNAHPEIANYPFTTLTPNLGVVDAGRSSILFADIPGLIEGASSGKGLGHDFLRHIERTAVILHLIDAYHEDAAGAYRTVRSELEAYSPDLVKRPEIVVLTKVEGLDEEIVNDLMRQIGRVAPKGTSVFAISSQSGQGLGELLAKVDKTVADVRAKAARKRARSKAPSGTPVITLDDASNKWEVKKSGKRFVVTGPRIEHFAKRTDFHNEQGVQRLRHIMQRAGIMHELIRQGIEPGQTVQVGPSEEANFTY